MKWLMKEMVGVWNVGGEYICTHHFSDLIHFKYLKYVFIKKNQIKKQTSLFCTLFYVDPSLPFKLKLVRGSRWGEYLYTFILPFICSYCTVHTLPRDFPPITMRWTHMMTSSLSEVLWLSYTLININADHKTCMITECIAVINSPFPSH